jgi:hypothetical protein
MAGVSWGSTPRCEVDFVPNGCYAHVEVEKDSVSLFEDSSWTHFQKLEVISGVPPLRFMFSMLNHKYLISALSTGGGHPLRRLLAVLSRLNSPKKVRELHMVGDYDQAA